MPIFVSLDDPSHQLGRSRCSSFSHLPRIGFAPLPRQLASRFSGAAENFRATYNPESTCKQPSSIQTFPPAPLPLMHWMEIHVACPVHLCCRCCTTLATPVLHTMEATCNEDSRSRPHSRRDEIWRGETRPSRYQSSHLFFFGHQAFQAHES